MTKRIFALLNVFVAAVLLCACGKYPQIIETKEFHATVEELIQDKRDFYFAVVSSDDTNDLLTFRVNKNFYEQAKVGQTMTVVRDTSKYLDGVSTKFLWNDTELENAFVLKTDSNDSDNIKTEITDIWVEVADIWVGTYPSYFYKVKLKDKDGEERIFPIDYDLYQSLYIGENLFIEKRPNENVKIKTYDYDLYLNDYWLGRV